MSAGFELSSISKKYGDCLALADISFAIRPGESVAILGPSGCGKSTLLRLLAGLDWPTTGHIFLDGDLISEPGGILLEPHKRNITMAFQDLALWPNLSVLENVLLGLKSQELSKKEAHQRAMETLSLCKIEFLWNRKPSKISGGEQQRVALARAIAPQPKFLFLDEPFSGLDLVTRHDLFEDISQLAERKGITLVLVTHDPLEAMTLCDDAVVFSQGRIDELGNLKDLLRKPKSEILLVFREYMKGLPT